MQNAFFEASQVPNFDVFIFILVFQGKHFVKVGHNMNFP